MNEDIRLQLTKIGNDAKKASNALSMASEDKKNKALMNMAELIENNQDVSLYDTLILYHHMIYI